MNKQTVRTTLTLPSELLEATDKVIKEGKAKIRNEFIARALENELKALKRAEIDAELIQMTQDPSYYAEVLRMEAEFSKASWEAFELREESQL